MHDTQTTADNSIVEYVCGLPTIMSMSLHPSPRPTTAPAVKLEGSLDTGVADSSSALPLKDACTTLRGPVPELLACAR